MYLIGIIDNKKDSKMERLIKLVNNEINIIRINSNNINEHSNKKFDIIVIEKTIDEIDVLLNNTKYIIINEDIKLSFNSDNLINIITFGFNHKSTATVSSVEEDIILISIQRSFKDINNIEILPQEVLIGKKEKLSVNKYIILKLIELILI